MEKDKSLETIEPEFWVSLSDEQQESVRHIAKRYQFHGSDKKFLNIRFNFWLFKPLFLVFIIGAEKRISERKISSSLADGTKIEVLRFLFYIVLSLGVIALAFMLIYVFEVFLGFDVIAGVELNSLFK